MRQEVEREGARTTEDRRLLSIRFESFGWEAVDKAASAAGTSNKELIADACGHLLVEADKGRPAASLPRMPAPAGGDERELELTLPARIWDLLDAEAERQGAELPRLIEHAALLYVSDLDAGRATNAILDELDED